MLCQLAELESKVNKISDWWVGWGASRASWFRRNNRPAISGLHPTAHEKHGCEQRYSIVLKPIFGYIKRRPRNIVVKSIAERGRFSNGHQSGRLLKRSFRSYIEVFST